MKLVTPRYLSRFSGKNVLSLEEFLFRKQVLKTYKEAMRVIYKHHEREELARFVRDEFKLNEGEKSLSHRRYLLQTGISRMNDMTKLLGISANFENIPQNFDNSSNLQ